MLNVSATACPQQRVKKTKVVHAYMTGSDICSVDWRWPDGLPEWRMSSQEARSWSDNGPLNELGRRMVLAHFGLETLERHLPLEKLMTMSPKRLLERRRRLEFQNPKLERLEPESNRPGDNVSAALAA